jgi:CubicO group peptidase (beta-lactamase class C family)
MIFRLACLIVVLLLARPAQAQDCAPPPDLKDGWQVATPQSADMDAALLCSIGTRFDAWKEANAHAVLVLRRGQLVYEKYFTGEDQRWGAPLGKVAYDGSQRHDMRSISKSVVALLTGIALERGWIASLDQSVYAFFPEHADLRTPEKDAMTIRHLLMMASGLAWNENLPYSNPQNSERIMTTAPDRVRYVLEQPLSTLPGSQYNYSGGATTLLAAILRKVSGLRLDAMAKTLLFDPLDISEAEWVSYMDGEPIAASGLRLRPRDLARIGQMVLEQGQWRGRRIVSTGWIAAMTAPQINGDGLFFYGYQWWLGRSLSDGQELQWSAAFGWGGQRLYIIPDRDLVIVVLAGLYYNPPLQGAVGNIVLNRHVLPAVSKR